MTTMFPTFGGNSVSPGQVSYASLSLTASISLDWPNFQGVGTNVYALVMDITANAGGYSITFPDATNVGPGTTALLRNLGSNTITILADDGSTITTVAAGVAKFLYLQDNSTAAGTWGVVTFGTGTSSADASLLAGYGLQAIGTTLSQSHPTVTSSGTITVSAPSDTAKVYVATGGSVAANLPTSASAGNNFFVIIKNDGSGTVTITPSGADTIDNAANLALAPNDSAMVCSLGSANAWVTIGYGRAVNFSFTQLVKSVAGGVDVTLTSAECANKLITFTGLLTANINVIVTNTISVYYIFNNTTGSFTLTVKTAAGAGVAVQQGTHDIAVCDGTNVARGITNTAATTAFSAGSAGAPSVTFIGSTSTGLYLPSANVLGMAANGFEVMSLNGPASSVNWIDVFSAATGVRPRLTANGTDASVGLALRPKGASGTVVLEDLNGNEVLTAGPGIASAVNELTAVNAATGTPPILSATGGDTNIALRITPKGTGKIQITDGTDITKVGEFDLSGLTTATVRTYTLPNASVALDGFASGTRLVFQQTAAPLGWTKEAGAAYNDAALRFTTGAASTGGADAFNTLFGTAKSTAGYTLLIADTPAHAHGGVTSSDGAHTHDYSSPTGGVAFFALNAGAGPANSACVNNTSTSNGTHSHTVTSEGGGGSHSHVLNNMNLKFADAIICQKN